jgi:3-hydroxyacyl-CoA dehydrogenase
MTPPQPPGADPLLQNGSARLRDIGDGVAQFELLTKMGTLDLGVFALLRQALALVERSMRAMVIHHDGRHFSAGANLKVFLAAAEAGDWESVEALVTAGQAAFKAMKYAPFPVVAAPFGLALGGGCEIVLHADAVQAHADLAMGLVECSVGLVPGWGGCGEMLDRLRDPAKVFDLVAPARTSRSAAEAREMGLLRSSDGITEDRDRLLAVAKARALALSETYHPPSPPVFHLPGPAGAAALMEHHEGSAHDRIVAGALARILSGAAADPAHPVGEAALLDLERAEFVALLRTAPTRERIAHTLATGKPLRN